MYCPLLESWYLSTTTINGHDNLRVQESIPLFAFYCLFNCITDANVRGTLSLLPSSDQHVSFRLRIHVKRITVSRQLYYLMLERLVCGPGGQFNIKSDSVWLSAVSKWSTGVERNERRRNKLMLVNLYIYCNNPFGFNLVPPFHLDKDEINE